MVVGALVVAVDGEAGSGKGTLARGLGRELDFAVLDTGILYRLVGERARGGVGGLEERAREAARGLSEGGLEEIGEEVLSGGRGGEWSGEEAALRASKAAAYASVREMLLESQREFARRPPWGRVGAVLAGRDVGTVVCPQAGAKLYMTASLEVRALRRAADLGCEEEEARRFLEERDARDKGRAASPLRRASDAMLLDTGDLGEEAVLERAREWVKERLGL